MSKTYLLKKEVVFIEVFSTCNSFWITPPPSHLNEIKRCEHIFQAKKSWSENKFFDLVYFFYRERNISIFFIKLTQRKKKSVVWHLLSSKERKITKLYVYEWRKRRHAPIVMHKIIVFLKTYYGKYICVYICNQYEASFLLK